MSDSLYFRAKGAVVEGIMHIATAYSHFISVCLQPSSG